MVDCQDFPGDLLDEVADGKLSCRYALFFGFVERQKLVWISLGRD